MSTNYFVGFWCNEGFESVIDVTDDYNDLVLAPLQGKKSTSKIGHIIHAMKIRARINSHRAYELYFLSAESSITIDFLRKLSNDSPQECANLFRKYGTALFKNSTASTVII